MSKRFCALTLVGFGIFGVILMSSGLIDEMFRTDVPTVQKAIGAWCGLIALMILPLCMGLHWLVPKKAYSPSSL